MITIWDDHDVADNAYRDGAKHHDPNEHGPWPERLRAAATARQEWLPADLRDPADPLTLYRSFTVGDLGEIVVLDTRIIGRDVQPDDDGTLPFDDPGAPMLGDEQRAWAHERIRDTSRPWCLLVTAVVLNHMELPVEHGAALGDLAPSGYAVIGGKAMCTDEWDGYPAERERLVEVIGDRGRGVVALLGGRPLGLGLRGPVPGSRRRGRRSRGRRVRGAVRHGHPRPGSSHPGGASCSTPWPTPCPRPAGSSSSTTGSWCWRWTPPRCGTTGTRSTPRTPTPRCTTAPRGPTGGIVRAGSSRSTSATTPMPRCGPAPGRYPRGRRSWCPHGPSRCWTRRSRGAGDGAGLLAGMVGRWRRSVSPPRCATAAAPDPPPRPPTTRAGPSVVG